MKKCAKGGLKSKLRDGQHQIEGSKERWTYIAPHDPDVQGQTSMRWSMGFRSSKDRQSRRGKGGYEGGMTELRARSGHVNDAKVAL